MTDEMLALARENRARSGFKNVEFLKGEIEHIPLPDNSVDVIISNCVINLSADKDRVIAEAFRVLISLSFWLPARFPVGVRLRIPINPTEVTYATTSSDSPRWR